MLKFIVLGQIPGTNVQINFYQLLVFGLLVLLAWEFLVTNVAEKSKASPAKAVRKTSKKSKSKTSKKKTNKRSKAAASRKKNAAKRRPASKRKLAAKTA